MSGGIWFQMLGPQTEKARFPNWVRVLMTTVNSCVGCRLPSQATSEAWCTPGDPV